MSDREVILRALELIRRRLRLTRTLHDAVTVLGMAAVALLMWRVLHIFAGRAPVVAAAVLAALLVWVVGLFLLARSLVVARCTLGAAAASVDARAGLSDELKTAYWFLQHPIPSPWIDAQVAHAAQSARRLSPVALLPLRFERRALIGGAVATALIVAAWLVPPLAPPSNAAPAGLGLSEAQASSVQLLRALIGQAQDEAAAQKLQQALDAFERNTATGEEQQRALSEAQRAIEQQDLQAASRREGLYRLADKLQGNKRLEEVARALGEGDAAHAARLMRQMAGPHDSSERQGGAVSSDQRDEEQVLERLFDEAAKGEDRAGQGETGSAAAREAVDRLNEIAQQLEVQEQLSRAARALQQLQLAVAQRSPLSAGRFGQQAAQNSTPAPQSGQTSMPGGMMFRTTAVARETTATEQQEGSKTGSALGDARADPVLGAKVTPLEVQLKQEAFASQRREEDQGAAKNWFYADSEQQRSMLGFEDVRARSSLTLGQSAALDGVSIAHRQIVKDYFMALRQDAPP